VLQRLSSASPSDRVAKALTTLGRIAKTIFILRYVHEEKIRRRVQLQLSRGEARHELARWLFFANRGESRTGDYEQIMDKASCLSLLSNAVLAWKRAPYHSRNLNERPRFRRGRIGFVSTSAFRGLCGRLGVNGSTRLLSSADGQDDIRWIYLMCTG
jgi:hypothetical protein